ncbi:hypothetical protein OG342_39005 [Streptomyces bobili]|uniref:hypothetical protein n=1 Tax=Streptomyces bobili TaxID=67280 RepID=UPI002256904D|nr:hypothetical protein [Streptomyces bobili]MCX5528774.1 hypothetical protein [Streptomyces bobili]
MNDEITTMVGRDFYSFDVGYWRSSAVPLSASTYGTSTYASRAPLGRGTHA